MPQKGLWNSAEKRMTEDRGAVERRETKSENTRPCAREKFLSICLRE